MTCFFITPCNKPDIVIEKMMVCDAYHDFTDCVTNISHHYSEKDNVPLRKIMFGIKFVCKHKCNVTVKELNGIKNRVLPLLKHDNDYPVMPIRKQ